MSKTTLISMIGLMSFMLFACVSKNQHVELQDELNSTETQLAGERQQNAERQHVAEKYHRRFEVRTAPGKNRRH
jgi:hypothetical protein